MRIDNPMFELSYFFAQSVPPAFRREHEETIITSYLQNLKRGGVEWEPLQMAMHYQVIPTPSHVLGRISPIFPPFFLVFWHFHRLDEAVPTSRKPEPRAKRQCQGRPNTVLAV